MPVGEHPRQPDRRARRPGAAAAWGRARGVPVLRDECYVEFTWDGPPRTILEHGTDGVVAVHSLSKRSNLAGVRAGFYAGDPELVDYLREVRKHAGLMVPGPVQAGRGGGMADDDHVDEQRDALPAPPRAAGRASSATASASTPRCPAAGSTCGCRRPSGDAWGFAERLADEAGVLVSPGEFYGAGGAGYVRLAVVQPDDRIELVAERLACDRR